MCILSGSLFDGSHPVNTLRTVHLMNVRRGSVLTHAFLCRTDPPSADALRGEPVTQSEVACPSEISKGSQAGGAQVRVRGHPPVIAMAGPVSGRGKTRAFIDGQARVKR